MRLGFFALPKSSDPPCLRLSNALTRLRKEGAEESAHKLEVMARECGRFCTTHGYLEDPIIGIVGAENVAFACPQCSGDLVREAWEREPIEK